MSTNAPEEIASAAELGELLRARREQAGLTQEEVAELLGVHRRYVWRMEHGLGNTYAERAFKLLSLYGTTLRPEDAVVEVVRTTNPRKRVVLEVPAKAGSSTAVEAEAPTPAPPPAQVALKNEERRRWFQRRR